MRSYPITLTAKTLFPARLVKITRLDGIVMRIAEADESITVSAQTFVPLPGCEISAVEHVTNGDMPSMEIRFAHSVGGTIDTAELHTGYWDAATVLVYIVDRASLSTLGDPHFTGTIEPVTVDIVGGSGSFDIRGLAAQAETAIQTRQPMCRTDLGSVLCTVDMASFAYTGTVGTIIDQFNFLVDGIHAGLDTNPPADGYFNQGTFFTDTGYKGVTANWNQGARRITTYLPRCISHLTTGQDITLYAGCDFRPVTCRTKFNNKINFQGEDHFLGVNSIVGV